MRLRNFDIKEIYEVTHWKFRLARTYLRAWIHRQRLAHVSFIGITGSAGKTTTKDLSYLILSAFYSVSSTYKSL